MPKFQFFLHFFLKGYNQDHYIEETAVWDKELAPPFQVTSEMQTPVISKRLAKIKADEKIHDVFRTPESTTEEESLLARGAEDVESPGYILSPAKDRLNILNNSMTQIAALNGTKWKNVPFRLVSYETLLHNPKSAGTFYFLILICVQKKPLEETSDGKVRLITECAANACIAVCGAVAPDQGKALFQKVVQRIVNEEPETALATDPILQSVISAIENVPNISKSNQIEAFICKDNLFSTAQKLHFLIHIHVLGAIILCSSILLLSR